MPGNRQQGVAEPQSKGACRPNLACFLCMYHDVGASLLLVLAQIGVLDGPDGALVDGRAGGQKQRESTREPPTSDSMTVQAVQSCQKRELSQ